MEPQSRRAARPTVEAMEARELLSGIMAVLTNPPKRIAASGSSGNAGTPSPSQGNSILTPLIGQGTPSPAEQARQAFYAVFNGPATVGPGRFSDQSSIQYIRGVGQSNFFFHGNLNLGFAVPTDPAKAPTGEALLQDKNTNSSGAVGLILTPVPGAVDRQGRITRATFEADPNIYSGIFFADTASGTVDSRYRGQMATVAFRGSIYTSGLTSPLKNADLVAREGAVA